MAQTCQGTEGAGEDTFRLRDDTPGSIETCDTGPLSPPSLLSIGFDDEAYASPASRDPPARIDIFKTRDES